MRVCLWRLLRRGRCTRRLPTSLDGGLEADTSNGLTAATSRAAGFITAAVQGRRSAKTVSLALDRAPRPGGRLCESLDPTYGCMEPDEKKRRKRTSSLTLLFVRRVNKK